MPLSRHTFARTNTDDADQQRPASDFIAATNVMLEPGQLYPITGNVLVDGYVLPPGDNVSLGALTDGATGTGVELLYNSAGQHRLIRYAPLGNGGAGSRTTLLEWTGLNLSPDLVLNGGVLDGLFIYRDASGELRSINLLRAAAGKYTADYLAREPFALHLVKVPPQGTITWRRLYEYSGVFGESLRIIQRNAYQFAVRYRYADGEQTTISSFSSWADVLSDPITVTFNVLILRLPTPTPLGVTEVEILVREPDSASFQVADTLRRDRTGKLPDTYRFYGQFNGGVLTNDEQSRLFEALWPCFTGPTFARSRVHAVDFLEGYPTPEPRFTAQVVSATPAATTGTLYTVNYITQTPNPDTGQLDTDFVTNLYTIASGTYPSPDSSYYEVVGLASSNLITSDISSYQEAFETNLPNQYNRSVNILPDMPFVTESDSNLLTLHENSPYPVSIQFYDALGRPFGAARPTTVFVPSRPKGDTTYRRIRVELTTTDPTQLNAEIPPEAHTYQWLMGINGRTKYFIEGVAADVLGYLGQKTVVNTDTNVSTDYENVIDGLNNPHEKLLIDIGNFTAAGIGYVFEPGSQAIVRFLTNDKQYPIIAQRGDYLEIARKDYPVEDLDSDRRCFSPIEIFVPNLTPNNILYERGPRLPIVRTQGDGGEQRRYGQPVTVLEGDAYLVPLNFPIPDRSDTDDETGSYDPPRKKSYVKAPAPTVVESMVPAFRLAPTHTSRVTEYTRNPRKSYFETLLTNPLGAFGYSNLFSSKDGPENRASTSVDQADTAARRASALLWLDASYGGRPAVVVPTQLQQVRRRALERFSGVKVAGTEINGLSRWEALNQYDKLPQEDGSVTGLALASQSQTTGKVLLAIMEKGVVSLYLGQQPIQTSADSVLISQTREVIGGDNDLDISLGCVDPATIANHDSKVFWYCREYAELVRYNKGLTRLAFTYKFRTRLRELATRYSVGKVTGCFDPRREEYWLTFHPTEAEPIGTTVVWSERREAWADEVSAVPTVGAGLHNELLTWQGGDLYRHLPTAPVATFYGVYQPYSVTLVTCQPDEAAKRWMSLEVRTNGDLWNATKISTDTGQLSRTKAEWWEKREGAYRLTTGLRRAENTPGFPSIWAALDRGNPLVSPRLTITFSGPSAAPAANPQPLTLVVVSWLLRAGQTLGV